MYGYKYISYFNHYIFNYIDLKERKNFFDFPPFLYLCYLFFRVYLCSLFSILYMLNVVKCYCYIGYNLYFCGVEIKEIFLELVDNPLKLFCYGIFRKLQNSRGSEEII